MDYTRDDYLRMAEMLREVFSGIGEVIDLLGDRARARSAAACSGSLATSR
jgi:hypothetical protein